MPAFLINSVENALYTKLLLSVSRKRLLNFFLPKIVCKYEWKRKTNRGLSAKATARLSGGEISSICFDSIFTENVMKRNLCVAMLSILSLSLIIFWHPFGTKININQFFSKTSAKFYQHGSKNSGPKIFSSPSHCWMFNAEWPKRSNNWSNCTTDRIVGCFFSPMLQIL